MSRLYNILFMFLVILIISSCKKNDPGTGVTADQMKDLKVPSGFNWETSRDVTFQIYSDQSSVISITSVTGDMQYYRGFFNGLDNYLPVRLNIPSYITQLLVNSIPVTISGITVPVYLLTENS